MTTSKSTKRALVASVLAMALCVALLVGTTFAWFTDSVTSGKNKIMAGNLDVELYQVNGASETPVTADTNLFGDDALWEPGYVNVINLKIANLGALALEYSLNVNISNETAGTNVNGESFKLSDYIEYAVVDGNNTYANRADAVAAAQAAGTSPVSQLAAGKKGVLYPTGKATADMPASEYITLIVYMPESVGNEANYKAGTTAPSIDFGVLLMATQTPFESDSFDDQYDVKAAKLLVGTAEELQDALADAADGDTIFLTSDIQLTAAAASIEKDITFDAQGHTITGKPMDIGGDNSVTVKNAVFDNAGGNRESNVYIKNASGVTVFENCVFDNTNWDGIQMTGNIEGSELIVNNCTFTSAAYRYIHVEAVDGDKPDFSTNVKVTITNNTFGENPSNDAIGLYYITTDGITAYNNTFASADPTIYICTDSVNPSISQQDAVAMFTAKK